MAQFAVNFVFNEEYDEILDETTLEISGIELGDSDLKPKALKAIAEHWGQSDDYWVDITNAIVDVVYTGKPKNF